MRIPLFISGPTVKRGTFYAARPADIYALLIEWFGLSEPKGNHDSINPFEPVSEDALWQKVAAIEHTLDGNPTLRQMIGVSDFVKKEIFPVVKPAQFPKILALAREEASRRTRLVAKLDGIIKSLEEQKTGKSEMKVVDPLYLDDHLDIATRTREWALHSRRIMDDEVEILSKCMNPASGSCRAL
jgi:hypothetical protein